MATMIAIPLADGRYIALSPDALAQGLAAAAALPGLTVKPTWAPEPPEVAERWVTSKQLADITGTGATTLETLAKDGVIPCFRAGRTLRFKPSEVEAALRARK